MSQRIPWNGKVPNYQQTLSLDKKGMMGYIDIPQIKVKDIPIYHGDDEKTLAIGVGHIQQTSLPIGGKNTHKVLAAHSGQVNDALFSNLSKLKKGDVFYLHPLNRTLKYEVYNIKVVKPSDVSTLGIEKGKDIATLVTCYPTGINNRRLLVTGKRLPLNKVTPSEHIDRNKFGYNFWVLLGSGLLALLGLLSLLFLLFKGRLYSVGLQALKEPTLADGQAEGEFGAGFYLTTSKRLANYRAKQLGDDAVVNVYRFKHAKRDLKYLIYYKQTENWKRFVSSNLNHAYDGKAHDYVKGPHSETEIKISRRHMQLVLQSATAFEHLKFIKSYSVSK